VDAHPIPKVVCHRRACPSLVASFAAGLAVWNGRERAKAPPPAQFARLEHERIRALRTDVRIATLCCAVSALRAFADERRIVLGETDGGRPACLLLPGEPVGVSSRHRTCSTKCTPWQTVPSGSCSSACASAGPSAGPVDFPHCSFVRLHSYMFIRLHMRTCTRSHTSFPRLKIFGKPAARSLGGGQVDKRVCSHGMGRPGQRGSY
jgi:hypothetical protein